MDYGLSFAVNIMERSFVLCQNKAQQSVSPPPLCQGSEISALWLSGPLGAVLHVTSLPGIVLLLSLEIHVI